MRMNTIDFMSPGGGDPTVVDHWISLETYPFLCDQLKEPDIKSNLIPNESHVIGISGLIYKDNRVTLNPWYRFEGAINIPLDNPGDYTIEYRGAIDELLGETAFDVSFLGPPDGGGAEQDFGGFSLRIPGLEGTEQINIKKVMETIAQIVLSPNSPVVDMSTPNGGEVFTTGETMSINYNASDQDGGDLFHVVLFSYDTGET